MKIVAAFSNPLSAIASLSTLEGENKITVCLYNYGQEFLSDLVDVLRYVCGVTELSFDSVTPRNEQGEAPYLFPFLIMGRAQCLAEHLSADKVLIDISASDVLREQTLELVRQQVAIISGARSVLGMPAVETKAPVLDKSQEEIRAMALSFLLEKLQDFYLSVHDQEVEAPIFASHKGWRAIEYEANRLGVEKESTWRDTILAIAEARTEELLQTFNP